jgi:hypothetical protein
VRWCANGQTDLSSELKRTALATIARLDRIDAVDARKAVLEVERQWLLSKHRVQVMIHDNAQYLSQLYSQYCEASRAGLGPMSYGRKLVTA